MTVPSGVSATPPRPLTPQEREELKTLAYKVEAVIVNACTGILEKGIDLAEALYVMKEKRLWQVLTYDSQAQFLAGLPIKMSEGHMFKLTRIYREYVVERGIPKAALKGADMENLQIALPGVKDGKYDPMKVVADAQTLTRGDMISVYREGDPDAPLDAEEEPQKHTCPDCGHRHIVKDAE